MEDFDYPLPTINQIGFGIHEQEEVQYLEVPSPSTYQSGGWQYTAGSRNRSDVLVTGLFIPSSSPRLCVLVAGSEEGLTLGVAGATSPLLLIANSRGYRTILTSGSIEYRIKRTRVYTWNYPGTYTPTRWVITGTEVIDGTGIVGTRTVYQEINASNFNAPGSSGSSGGGWWNNYGLNQIAYYDNVIFANSGIYSVSYYREEGSWDIPPFRSVINTYYTIRFYYRTGADYPYSYSYLAGSTTPMTESEVKSFGYFVWGSCGFDDLDFANWQTGLALSDFFHTYAVSSSSSYIFNENYCCCDDVLNGRYAQLITDAGNIIRPSPGSLIL